MSIYLKTFINHNKYNAYINSNSLILPNVSLCENENDVHFNPWIETRLVAKFNVTDASSPTQIISEDADSPFSAIEIDGVVQPSVVNTYTFSTLGEHTIKYTLTDQTNIGNDAFWSCKDLTSIEIPNSVTNIGQYAFGACSGLTSCTIGSGVTSIGHHAFASCSNLTRLNSDVNGVFNIPNGVTSIDNFVFDRCSGFTSINIPNSVTNIGSDAFWDCIGLTSINIPDSVISIGRQAFEGCTGLISCTIGSGVTSIGTKAFRNCTNLISIVSNAVTAPTITSDTFCEVKTSGTLTVPSGSSGYDIWMGTGYYYLGLYNWTKVEQ